MGQLRLQGVTRRFGPVTALDHLDLTIEGGEFIALLGPSGCGKSTALSCLAGLLPLSEGAIWADDVRIDTLPSEKREFGMVFQNYALFPHLSIRDNVGFGLKVRGVNKQELRARVDEALAMVDLQEHASKLPGQLSGGQQQRVAIARAVVLRPRLVLMDEPLSNLDAKLRLQMRTEIRRLHQSLKLTTIYVTHDQEEALALADRVVVLRRSKVDQVGPPEEVYNRPINTYVASFMGFRNLFSVETTSSTGQQGIVGARSHGNSFQVTAQRPIQAGRAIMAIRPEDFQLGPVDGNSLRVRAVVVEFSGHTFVVEGVTEAGEVIHLRLKDRVSAGDTIEVGFSPYSALLFTGDECSDDVVQTAAAVQVEVFS
ncbi:spermidine/putrescine ABC transporter ATP-binding protein [Paenarthrobacter ureafaciens]|nr:MULTISPECIES: ABC transporter ATP-binding protein [Paenarthrobacter]NWL26755.1 spermidine/putrescine ABC transporter ATP-binding protein [Paenarthrobacter ureafaciens]NWL31975.1 spermidine/putrescine ABC transporter ATP-binding protein [Paenarthrobacter nitroguajacolicus]